VYGIVAYADSDENGWSSIACRVVAIAVGAPIQFAFCTLHSSLKKNHAVPVDSAPRFPDI
jgi:hypothetical protein